MAVILNMKNGFFNSLINKRERTQRKSILNRIASNASYDLEFRVVDASVGRGFLKKSNESYSVLCLSIRSLIP